MCAVRVRLRLRLRVRMVTPRRPANAAKGNDITRIVVARPQQTQGMRMKRVWERE